jgi:hypothetical protein
VRGGAIVDLGQAPGSLARGWCYIVTKAKKGEEMKRLSGIPFVSALSTLLIFGPAAMSNGQEADRVYRNGNIYQVDEDFSTATAFAVKDGRFLYVGDDARVRAHIGPLTFVVDLDVGVRGGFWADMISPKILVRVA